MKKFFVLSFFLAFSAPLFAQVEVTKFLGIPVDGKKEDFISRLTEKGFSIVSDTDGILEGEFNGKNVYVAVQTNNRKVWRIGVIDKNGCDETQIKINFNNLCLQFEENSKYIGSRNQTISEDEDIDYEMSVHNKRYEAVFYQKSQEKNEEENGDTAEEILKGTMNRLVWFMIAESPLRYGKYIIEMFYENGYNKANGEDL